MSEAIFRMREVFHGYPQGRGRLNVLSGVSLDILPGQLVALIGPSGAGKSTLLHVAGLLERPDGGEVELSGRLCGQLNDSERTAARRTGIGFVYQYHHLLPEFTALENVVLPQMIAGQQRRQAAKRSGDLLARLGLHDRLRHRPGQLSGGEQQRVAIARALANEPKLLLADEPTGNLDPHTAQQVLSLLIELARQAQLAAIIATHNTGLAAQLDAIVELREGRLVPA